MRCSTLCYLVLLCAFISISTLFAQNCSQTTVGLKPINELSGNQYKGYQGGFYPNAQNVRPSTHDSAGRALAQLIKPLDTKGSVDLSNGKIVLLSIGMSNTTQEYSVFKQIADTDRTKNPRVLVVDGAQGGQTAAIISSTSANFWTVVDQRLTAAGVTRSHVQVVWIKEADANPTQAFPTHATTLQHELEAIARIAKSLYPNTRLAYVSSRTYGGYATSTLNPEPYAYESGFSVKWMVEKQISGDTSLAYAGPTVRSPWLAWGPYLWADGTTQRTDGLTWQCTDTQPSDGTHPTSSGCLKVATLLSNFFKSDPTASSWFLKTPTTGIAAEQSEIPSCIWLAQNYPNPFNGTTNFEVRIANSEFVTMQVSDMLGRTVATLVNRELPPGIHHIPFTADHLPSGVYFCRLVSGMYRETRSMILSK
jgi:hypothetical protein